MNYKVKITNIESVVKIKHSGKAWDGIEKFFIFKNIKILGNKDQKTKIC